ncbi:MAG: serine/threonine protein kinase, partial [Myxococcales bacterium]|nr:serine/threonine protein kinase [Myxococcales bacterium]
MEPQRHGRYTLTRQIGEGGMGEVYLAEDTRLKVQRAIKVLKLPEGLPEEEAAGLRARMIQEARAAQALAETSHHVVRVFDVGHDPVRGEPFLVMEL